MKHFLYLFLGFSAVFAPSLHAADWPQFRGPTGNGVVTDTNLPLKWSESDLLWKTELPGPGSSSPIVVGDRVFLTSYSGYGTDVRDPGDLSNLKRHAICLSRRDGKIMWQHEVKSPYSDKPYQGQYITMHGYASSTPVSDGQGVFFFLGNAGVHAFTVDGRKVWEVSVGEKAHEWGVGTSPMLYGDLVIVNAAHESNALIALDRRTGKTVWSVSGFPASWNTPTIMKVDGHDELVVNASGKLRAFNPKTGEELWSCQAIRAAELCPTIVAHDGVIYISGGPNSQSMAIRAGGKGDVTATHVLWKQAKGSNVGSPVYHNGHLYIVNDSRGIAICMDAKTGDVVYEQPMPTKRDRWYASPLLVGDRLYYVGRTSGTVVLAAKPQFEVLATNVIAGDDAVSNASPAVADGQVFLRSDRYAYCIGAKK
ncbi:PQQ-binding-like beta-propeller repeat protein [Roseimicrobium gellanilyticum]|nr:PQQ-binding-like beta-propeller repeat protein [Roseimicrobium gellanilyticum]